MSLIGLVKNNAVNKIRHLLNTTKVDVNIKDNYGDSALKIAVQNERTEIVKLLLDVEDIDINIKDKIGYTALLYATLGDYNEIVRLLLRGMKTHKKVSVDEPVEEKDGSIVVNNQAVFGWTALMFAAKYGNTEIVKLLLNVKGINVDLTNSDGYTALMLAAENGHTPIVELIQRHKIDMAGEIGNTIKEVIIKTLGSEYVGGVNEVSESIASIVNISQGGKSIRRKY